MEYGNMLLTILTALLLGGAAGMFGAVYKGILAHEPILHWWFAWGAQFEGKWFFYPAVWGCVKCISGQFALWFYVFLQIIPTLGTGGPWFIKAAALTFGLFVAITTAIFTGLAIIKAISKIE